MDIKERLNKLEHALKKHDPHIGLCRKVDGGGIEIGMDGQKMCFASEDEARSYMKKLPDTIFVLLWRESD